MTFWGDTDGWTMLLKTVGALTAILVFIEALRRVAITPMARTVRFIMNVVRDINGTPDRDGLPGTPGLMEMMMTVAATQKAQGEKLTNVVEGQRKMAGEQQVIKKHVARLEYHTGNGHEPSLRTLVEENTALTAAASQGLEEVKERLGALEGEREERIKSRRQDETPDTTKQES